MDIPIERNLPDGVEEYILQGGALDLEFSIGEYSQLNLHQKIDLAYKKMVDVGQDMIPLPPPTSPDIIHDEQYEQQRQDAYFNKWIKQNEHLYSKYKEFYYYLIENEDEIMSTDITKDHQIKMSEIEISDYGEEFDDVFNNHGEFLGPNEEEISEDEFDQICEKFEAQDKIKTPVRASSSPLLYTNEYRKAYLMFLRTSALNPRRFITRFMDYNYKPINPFRNRIERWRILQIHKIKDNLDLLNTYLVNMYIILCSSMREEIVEYESDPMNVFKRNIKNQLKTQEQIYNKPQSLSSSQPLPLPTILIPNLNPPAPPTQQQQQQYQQQQQQQQSHIYQQRRISPVSNNYQSNSPQFDSPLSQYNSPPPDQYPSSVSSDDYEDYDNTISNNQGQMYAQINGKLVRMQGYIRTNQGRVLMTPQQMMSMFQGKKMLVTYKTTGQSMGDDSYYSDDDQYEDQESDYRSGNSNQSATIGEDKEDKDKQNKEEKKNTDKDSKKVVYELGKQAKVEILAIFLLIRLIVIFYLCRKTQSLIFNEGHSEQGKEVFSFLNAGNGPVFEDAAAPDELLWCIANDIGNGVVDETWVWGAGAAQSKEEALQRVCGQL
ncbi:MAG: hypothetical protein EZS28_033985, partial [Streblomastix strix]